MPSCHICRDFGTLPWPYRGISQPFVKQLIDIKLNKDLNAQIQKVSTSTGYDIRSPNNILLDRNFSVKVADFGLSRRFPLDATHISTAPQGTPGYVEPEYHECYQLTDKSDVYSFRVILVELISSLPVVDITRHRHEINLSNLAISRIQTNALGELIDSSLGYGSDPEVTRMTSDVAELAFRCLQSEKEMRPSMDEVVDILEAIKRGPNNSGVEKGVGISPSPESDGTGLLKNRKLPHSPLSVTEDWVSGSSTASV